MRSFWLRSLLMVLFLTLASGVALPCGAACVDYASLFHSLGSCYLPAAGRDVAVTGDYAIAVTAGGLSVLDVSSMEDHGGPVPRGSLQLPGSPRAVGVQGDRAYVALDSAVLLVVDIGNPDVPTLVAQIATPHPNADLAVAGGHIYVATLGGLDIFNLADPDHPAWMGGLPGPGLAGIAVQGQTAYIGTGWVSPGFWTVDVSDPALPQAVSFLPMDFPVEDVAVDGDLAYVGGGQAWLSENTGDLRIVNVQDPSSPFLLGSLHFDSNVVLGVATFRGAAYLSFLSAEAGGDPGGFLVVDASDPSAPRVVNVVSVIHAGARLSIAGNHLFYPYGGESEGALQGFYVSGVHDAVLSTLDLVQEIRATGADGDEIAVVGSDWNLTLADISDPEEPQIQGTIEIGPGPRAVRLQGDFAYVGLQNSPLVVVNVSAPLHPWIVATLPTLLGVEQLKVRDGYLYAARGSAGLSMIDIHDPTEPWICGEVGTNGSARDLDLVGAFAVLANQTNLLTVDLTDPGSPFVAGSLNLPAVRVATSGLWAFVLPPVSEALYVVDVSDPHAPFLAQTFELDSHGNDLHSDGPYLYVAVDEGLEILEISNPLRPVLVGQLCPPEMDGVRVERAGQAILLSGSDERLTLLPLQCEVAAAPEPEDAEGGHQEREPRAGSLVLVPNPAGGAVAARWSLPAAGPVRLSVFDSSGREVRRLAEGPRGAGAHQVVWDGLDEAGSPLPAGTYWIRLEGAGGDHSSRLVLLQRGR